MANFTTHLLVGMGASGLATTALVKSGEVGQGMALWLFVLGSIGSLLPDLDADNSTPLRHTFDLLSLLGAFLLMFQFVAGYSLPELVLVWALAYLLLRYGLFWVFTRFTVHRGVFHSLPATLLAGTLTTLALYRGLQLPAQGAWLGGVMVSLGYLIHLLLDELFSVNLMGVSLKHSFGTALKPFSLTPWWPSLLAYLLLALTLGWTPPVAELLHIWPISP